jgi:eukaryotic-like serine/threonine-protein kinase
MGTVWLARLTGKHGFERLVALKTILATYGGDRQFCDMFLDEARIAAQIDHENVARILEIGEDRGVLYHAMELIDGESLRKLYRDVRAVGAPFPLPVALRIAADVCSGLHAVHELRGEDGASLEVVHRDVSPQNILISIRGTIKLIDFGVAKARQRRTEETTAGTLKGKIEYMAPEQARGEALDRRADVYAVGAVLYELLAGEPVRNTEEGRQLLALHELMTGAPYAPLHTSIPLPVRSIVDRALARDPELRFRSTEDMRHAIEQAMGAIGHPANADDVANVLAHFSRERTARRHEAINQVVKAAQELQRSGERPASVHTKIAPVPAVIDPVNGPRTGSGSGPQGTRVMSMGALGIMPRHLSDGPSTGGSITGPSMLSMQGASISEPPPAPQSSAGKIFAALVVLSVVAVLGVIGGIVVSRNSMAPAQNPSPNVTSLPTTQPPPPLPSAPPSRLAAVGPDGGQASDAPVVGTILGASDAGAIPPIGSMADAPPPKPATNTAGKRGSGKGTGRAGGQKPAGDEYGF